MLLAVFILLLISNSVSSKSIIKFLPGFAGDLPFYLETGYIGVGDLDEVQLFYYFIESERSPREDPLVLWLTGGPGCSGFSGLVYEIGPLTFDYAKSSGKKPVFALNPYSWTKIANIIFLDAPVGTGFSYATTWEAYNVDDTTAAAQNYEFLRKWLVDHPKFLTNPLYVAGDSYSGIVLPIVVQEIYSGNEIGRRPEMNLQGYVIGNPFTDYKIDLNSKVPFAHLKALISDELYESFETDCKGEFLYPDPSNAACLVDVQYIWECIGRLDTAQILEPTCPSLSPKPTASNKWDPATFIDDPIDLLLAKPGPWCRNYNYLFSYIWANDKTVQEALHIREGTKQDWTRCNRSLSYSYNVLSTIAYHQNFTTKGLRSLIYSGDHDMVIPYVGTTKWIDLLNLTVAYDWGPWFVEGQVAGYVIQYSHGAHYTLTYATVKGGGHTAPEYKPKQCFAMMDRWFAYYPV